MISYERMKMFFLLSVFVGTLFFSTGCKRDRSEHEKIQADFISSGGIDGSKVNIGPTTVTGVVITNIQVRSGLYNVVFKDQNNHSRESLWSALSAKPQVIGSEIEAEQIGLKSNPFGITTYTFFIKEK